MNSDNIEKNNKHDDYIYIRPNIKNKMLEPNDIVPTKKSVI
jgi:hypothetical protein